MATSKLLRPTHRTPPAHPQRADCSRAGVAALSGLLSVVLALACTSAVAVTPVTNQPGPHATDGQITTDAQPNATGMVQTSSTTDPDASRTLSTAAQRGSQVPTASAVSNSNSTSPTAIHEGSEKPARQASTRGGGKRSKQSTKNSNGAGGFDNGLYGTGAGGSH